MNDFSHFSDARNYEIYSKWLSALSLDAPFKFIAIMSGDVQLLFET